MPKADRERILEALKLVAQDLSVRQSFVTELVGEPGVWRLRKGEWRAVYTIESGDVVVRNVGHRREVYK
jgi:mRNA interferase RelE/StbE